VKSPGGSLLELTAFTAVIWMFTIPWFLDNKTINVLRHHLVSHSMNDLRQIWPTCPGIFYKLKFLNDVMPRYHDFSMKGQGEVTPILMETR